MKTFQDLEFKDHPCLGGNEKQKEEIIRISPIFEGSKQAIISFDNGHTLSVIFGKIFYSNGINTYEAMATTDNKPKGYLTEDEVTKYMEEVQKRAKL